MAVCSWDLTLTLFTQSCIHSLSLPYTLPCYLTLLPFTHIIHTLIYTHSLTLPYTSNTQLYSFILPLFTHYSVMHTLAHQIIKSLIIYIIHSLIYTHSLTCTILYLVISIHAILYTHLTFMHTLLHTHHAYYLIHLLPCHAHLFTLAYTSTKQLYLFKLSISGDLHMERHVMIIEIEYIPMTPYC